MSKPMRMDRQVEEILRAGINLIFDGLIQCFHQVYTEVITGPGLSALFQDRVELGVMYNVTPMSTSSRWFHTEPKEGPQNTSKLFSAVQRPDHGVLKLTVVV